MSCSGPPISSPTRLPQFGFKTAAAAFSRKTNSNHSHNGEDLTNRLSDDILIVIIARLPTKEAVRTSILSNRWWGLYKFAPDVDLNSECLVGTSPCDQALFCYAVNRFLRLRSGFPVRSLNLTHYLKTPHSHDQYEQFLYHLGRSFGLERLAIHSSASFRELLFYCHWLSKIPSLKHFSLSFCFLQHDQNMSKLNNYNSQLQDLRLTGVSVYDGALECILANCSSLRSLSIDNCLLLTSKLIFRGPNLELKSLWVRDCTEIAEIELYASNLVTFEFVSLFAVNFRFDHVPKLESMHLDFENRNTMSYVCTNLVRDLPRLKSLSFGTKGDIFQVSSTTMEFNTFSKLKQLSLCLTTTSRVNLLSLAPFLERCPSLQEFHLDTEFVECDYGEQVKRPIAITHPELKKVEITGHRGTKPEVEFALYILESAICLEQMQISRCVKSYKGCGCWDWRDKPHWTKRTLETIHGQLQGHAISNKARLIIQHSPISLEHCSPFNIVDS